MTTEVVLGCCCGDQVTTCADYFLQCFGTNTPSAWPQTCNFYSSFSQIRSDNSGTALSVIRQTVISCQVVATGHLEYSQQMQTYGWRIHGEALTRYRELQYGWCTEDQTLAPSLQSTMNLDGSIAMHGFVRCRMNNIPSGDSACCAAGTCLKLPGWSVEIGNEYATEFIGDQYLFGTTQAHGCFCKVLLAYGIPCSGTTNAMVNIIGRVSFKHGCSVNEESLNACYPSADLPIPFGDFSFIGLIEGVQVRKNQIALPYGGYMSETGSARISFV